MPNVHGSWHLDTCGRVVIARIEGAFNAEGVAGATSDILALVRQLERPAPYAILNDMRRWLLHTPDAQPVVDRFSEQMEALGVTHFATIVGESGLREAVVETFEHAQTIHRGVFATECEARNWLIAGGFDELSCEPDNDRQNECG